MTDDGSCLLFADDTTSGQLGSALRSACNDLDSRGTLDAAAPVIDWAHAGISVSVEQQALIFSDTAALVWVAPMLTARWLVSEQHGSQSLGATLDLGAGTGFLGIYVMRAGLARRMCLADRTTRLRHLRRNIDRNFSATSVQASCIPTSALGLDWGDVDAARKLRGHFDTVLCSDCIYDPSLYAPLLATLSALAAPRLVLSFAQRHEANEASFLHRLSSDACYTPELMQRDSLHGTVILIYDCRRCAPVGCDAPVTAEPAVGGHGGSSDATSGTAGAAGGRAAIETTFAADAPLAAMALPEGFHHIVGGATASELRRCLGSGGQQVELDDGRRVALFSHAGAWYAIDAVCPHQGADLALGEIEELSDGPCVSCPRHGWTFDLATGFCEDLGDVALRAYEVRELHSGHLCVGPVRSVV